MEDQIKPDKGFPGSQLGLKFNIPFYNNTLPMMIWDFKTLDILEVNEKAVEAYGYSREEFLQINLLDLKHKEEVGDVRAIIESIAEKEKYHSLGIYHYIKKDKSSIKVEISGYEIIYQDKDCMLVVCNDITEKEENVQKTKENEQELFNSKQQLSLIYNNVKDIVFLIDVEENKKFKFASVNRSFIDSTGLSEKNTVGQYVNDIIPEPSLSVVIGKYREAIEKKAKITWEETTQYPTGTKDGIVTINPVFDSEGNCTQLIGSVQDITERKKEEQKLKALYKERNAILESIGDAFFAVDSNWTVTYWNNMAEKVLKKPKGKILNKNLWEVFSESIGSESYKKYHEAIETKQAVRFEDYYPPLNKWYEICAYPSNGGLSVYFKDITDNKSYTDAIQEQNKKLREISWMQSHLVRAPLARIMALVPLIAEPKQSDAERWEMLQFLTLSANELDAVIKDITEKSKIIDP